MRMLFEPIKYQFSMNLKLSQLHGATGIEGVFKNLEDLFVSSKLFDDLDSAVSSSSALNTEIFNSLKTFFGEDAFSIISEVNPKRSDQPTISTEWGDNELAKIWIVDSRNPSTSNELKAVALSQILEVHDEPSTLN